MHLRYLSAILLFFLSLSRSFGMFSSDSEVGGWEIPEVVRPQVIAELEDFPCSENLDVFPFDCGAGNFVVAVYQGIVSVFDAGSNSVSWSDFLQKQEELLSKIFTGRQLSCVVISHHDKDHFNFLPDLFSFIREKNPDEATPVTFFLNAFSSGENDSINIPLNVRSCIDRCSKFIRVDCVYQVLLSGSSPAGANLSCWKYDNGDVVERIDTVISKCVFGSADETKAVQFLSPILPFRKPEDTNTQSLVFRLNYNGQTLLITGDATGDTLSAINGNAKGDDDFVVTRSRYNRNLLRCVHVLLAPHHGADTENSQQWLPYVISKSGYNFSCAIFSTSCGSTYNHPRESIKMFSFPPSARSMPGHSIQYHRAEQVPGGRRSYITLRKRTQKNLFETGTSKCGSLWLRLSEEGMFMFSEEISALIPLVSKFGWNMKTQYIIDNLASANLMAVFTTVTSPLLLTSGELNVCNAQGDAPFLWLLKRAKEEEAVWGVIEALSVAFFINMGNEKAAYYLSLIMEAILPSTEELDDFLQDEIRRHQEVSMPLESLVKCILPTDNLISVCDMDLDIPDQYSASTCLINFLRQFRENPESQPEMIISEDMLYLLENHMLKCGGPSHVLE